MENIADKGLNVEFWGGSCSRFGNGRIDQVVGVGQGWNGLRGFGRVAGHTPNVALLDFSVKVGCHKKRIYFCGKLFNPGFQSFNVSRLYGVGGGGTHPSQRTRSMGTPCVADVVD
jgi:hypothetical protein